jgi:hypothetical protein
LIDARKVFVPALILASAWLLLGSAPRAGAQDTGAPPAPQPAAQDSTAVPPPAQQPPPTPEKQPSVTSTVRYIPEDRDRFEFGAGPVQGFFGILGNVSYRRWLGQGPVFEQSLMLEVSGSAKDQLTEGALGIYLFMRPSFTYKESWRIRPLLEFGPAAHTVVQVASLEGLSRTLYKSEVYVKTHAYAGFEVVLSRKVGFLVRGRISAPSHRPMDYAQAAIFLK